jgi:hypothetical protein
MAVIQISKIQVRRGLQENLPQLASAELGWSIDERRLWIGNGTLAEGAPLVGNTEVLTANSDILAALESYQFKGDESGYTSLTGPTSTSFTERTFGHKLDEQISARDFGATGDGVTDDSLALQRAIDQIYPTAYYSSVGVRRRLHIPAGTYNLKGNALVLPSFASIFGDGPESTIIKHTTSSNVVIKLRDSLGQSDSSLGGSSAALPRQIDINSLTLESDTDDNIAVIDSATDIIFNRVQFVGNITSPLTTSTFKAAVSVLDNVRTSSRVSFIDSSFANITYGANIRGSVNTVSFNNCNFDTLYQGIRLSANVSSPKAVKITNSMFNNIAKQAIYADGDSSTISAFNYYRTVGFGDSTLLANVSANTSVLSWNTTNNYSISDQFDRNSANILIKPLVELLSTTAPTLVQASTSGSVQDTPGASVLLTANTWVATSTGLTINSGSTNIIDYSITRGTTYRVGTIKVTQLSGTAIFEDDYSETANVGVILAFASSGTRANLTYVVPNAFPVSNATLEYTIRSFI